MRKVNSKIWIVCFIAILLLAGGNIYSQAVPEHIEPGVYFFRPSAHSIEWIRNHHPIRVKSYGYCKTNPDFDTTIEYEFRYSGDTIVLSTKSQDPAVGTTIEKYDSNDTLRAWQNYAEGMTIIKTFDSLGRELKDDENISSARLLKLGLHPIHWRWLYTDNDHFCREEWEGYVTIRYYGVHKRIDSVHEFEKGKKTKIAKREFYYYEGNQLRFVISKGQYDGTIDSLFYHPNGLIARTASYALGCWNDTVKHQDPCLCREERYDSLGNEILAIAPLSKYDDCGEDLDTNRSEIKYDSLGRPIEWSMDNDGRCEYEWGGTNELIHYRSYLSDGSLENDIHYIYEF